MEKRDEVLDKYKWSFADYFENDEAWEREFSALCLDFKTLESYRDKDFADKKILLEMLRENVALSVRARTLYFYAQHNLDLNVANSTYQIMTNKIQNTYNDLAVATSFMLPKMCKLDDDYLKNLLKDKDFAPFESDIRAVLQQKPYVKSEAEEKLLSQIDYGDTFEKVFSDFESGDLKFKDVFDSTGKVYEMNLNVPYLQNADSVLRENTFRELNGAFGRFNNFLSSNYLGNVKKDVRHAQIYNFPSALDMALHGEEVPPAVYFALIRNVEKNLPLNHEYFEVKRQLLGLDVFKLCDVQFNPFVNNKKYTYEEAFDTVHTALSVLGEDYTSYLKKMFDKKMIDVYPTENKTSGAFEDCVYGKTPRVLLNFIGEYRDVSTLAHELGHAMHSHYSNLSQSASNSGTPIFLAEIASTVNEMLLSEYMLKNAKTDDEKIYYINEFLFDFYATVFRQTMFASFEEKIHNKQEKNLPLSSTILNETYLDLVKKYFGSRVEILDEVKYEWSRIPHFYYGFYVFKYATGLICAINIVQNIKNGKISVEDYKNFLRSGCVKTPTDTLKLVKIDLENDETYDVVFNFVREKINDLKILKKIKK